jgi:hypothetical protein
MRCLRSVYRQKDSAAKHFSLAATFQLVRSYCLAATLRPGYVYSADERKELPLRGIERQQKQGRRQYFGSFRLPSQ